MSTDTAEQLRRSLLTLEAYAKVRKAQRGEMIAHRKLRPVHLGEHVSVQYEDEQTISRQIQEMLPIEKILDEKGIQSELDAYASTTPAAKECPVAGQRALQLAEAESLDEQLPDAVGAYTVCYSHLTPPATSRLQLHLVRGDYHLYTKNKQKYSSIT